MALKCIIAHKLERNGDTNASLELRNDTWPKNDLSTSCFKTLKQQALRRTGRDYGCIEQDHPFGALVSEITANEDTFVERSHKMLSIFETELNRSELAFSYYLVIALERLENKEILHCYFLDQIATQHLDEELEIQTGISLDTNIKLGVKINLSELHSPDENLNTRAVTLFRFRGDKNVNKLLEQATGFCDKKDIGSETETLLSSISNYTKGLPDEVAVMAKHQAVNYCLEREKLGEAVAIKELSQDLQEHMDSHQASSSSNNAYEPPPKFENFVLENNQEMKTEIIPDKNKLKNFMRISGRNEQMSMSFSSSCLGDSVVYDPSTDSLIVKTIPSSLKTRLIKLLQTEN